MKRQFIHVKLRKIDLCQHLCYFPAPVCAKIKADNDFAIFYCCYWLLSLINNYGWFDKMAMFLKISSGTYNLDKAIEWHNEVEKYSVYKLQKYIGKLLKIMIKSQPTL